MKEVCVALARRFRHRQEGGGGRARRSRAVADAAKWADVVMMLTPDELQRDIYAN